MAQPVDHTQPGIRVISEQPSQRGSNIVGSVGLLGVPGANLVSASCMAWHESGSHLASFTNNYGQFSLDNLPLGLNRLVIQASGYQTVDTSLVITVPTSYVVDAQLIEQVDLTEKPIIYFYPPEPMMVRVKLDFAGSISCSYPKYPQSGWELTAMPDGTLYDESGKEYYALYWEGVPNVPISPQNGFVVRGEDAAVFLEDKLAYLGLNRREANEFILYWLPKLEANAFNLIHFSGIEYENQAGLVVSPAPESVIRVMMLVEPSNTPVELPEQDLSSLKRQRSGFTVVEWGGSFVAFDRAVSIGE